jgi:hypothetical protein
MTTRAEVDAWRAEHLRLSAKRLETYIARVQAQADEYRAIADRLDARLALSSNQRGAD